METNLAETVHDDLQAINIKYFFFHYIGEVGDPVLHGDRVSPKLVLVPILEEKVQRFRALLVRLVSLT